MRRSVLLLTAAAAVCALLLLPAGSTGAAGPDLGRELRGLVALPGGPPGAIAIVQRFGRTSVYSAGVRDVHARTAPGRNDHMRLASTSKAFSGAVALALVSRGKLSLSDTIGKRLPKLPRRWHAVKLAQLLHHTGGMPDFTATQAFQRYVAEHLHATPAPLRMLHFVWDRPLDFRPGSRFRYSNTDNFVVALMAEAVTHEPYTRLLSRYVYRPLRLTGTSLPRGAEMPNPYIRGYEVDSSGPPQDVTKLASAAFAWASGGLVSTPADINRFIRGYVGARLFSPRVRTQQRRFVPGNSEPTGPGQNAAGLGIFRYRTRCGTVYGHTGNTFGYTQFMAASADGRRSVTVSVSEQITPKSKGAQLTAFRRLRAIETDAVCRALG